MSRRMQPLKEACISAGIWEEYQRRREELREQFQREGLGRYEAGKKATYQLQEEFTSRVGLDGKDTGKRRGIPEPLGPATPETPTACKLADFARETNEDLRTAVLWVAQHVCVTDVTVDMAPGKLAWNMLLWVRTSGIAWNTFMGQLLKPLLPTKTRRDAEEQQTDDDGSGSIQLAEELKARRAPALRAGA